MTSICNTKSFLILLKLLYRVSPPDFLRGQSTNQPVGQGDGVGSRLCFLLALEFSRCSFLKFSSQFSKVIVKFL